MEVTQATTNEVYKDVSLMIRQPIKQEKDPDSECMTGPSGSADHQGHIKKESSITGAGVPIYTSCTQTLLTENQQMHEMGQDLSLETPTKMSPTAAAETTIKGPFQCPICDTTFSDTVTEHTCNRVYRYRAADDLCRNKGMHSCDLCGEAFWTRKALLKHKNTAHSEGSTNLIDTHIQTKNSCAYCHKTFKRRYHLVEHERIHTNDKPFDCQKCGKAFTRASERNKHVLVKHKQLHGDRPHTCDVCKKLFPTYKDLQKHLRHPKKDDYTCYICNKKFQSHPDLKKHMESHKDVPSSHMCEKCKKSFKTASLLQEHRRVHWKLNTHACRICQKNFKGLRGLRLHMLTHNKARRKAEAATKICPSSSKISASSRMSAPTNTFEKYCCAICSNTFQTYYRMRQHKKMHQDRLFMCDVCEEMFVSRAGLNQHKRRECADACTCDICSKAFVSENKLQRHKIKHILERPYLCGICLQPFKTTTQLKAHMLIHTGKKLLTSQKGGQSKRMLDALSFTSLVSAGDRDSDKERSVQGSLKSDALGRKISKHGKHTYMYSCECGRTFKQSADLKQHKLIHTTVHLSSYLDELSTNQPQGVTSPESQIAIFSNSPLNGRMTTCMIPSVAVMPPNPLGSLPGSLMDQPQVASVSLGSLLSTPILGQLDAADSFHSFVCDICQDVLPSITELDCHRQNHNVAKLATSSVNPTAVQSPLLRSDLAVASSSDDVVKSDCTKTQVSDSDGNIGHEDLSNKNSELVELSCTAILSPPENTIASCSRTSNRNLLDVQPLSENVSHTSAYQLFSKKKCQVVISKLQYFSCGVCNKDFPSLEKLDSHKHEQVHLKKQTPNESHAAEKESARPRRVPKKVVYKCKSCPRVFDSAIMLEEHRKSSHTDNRPYQCDKCDKNYLCRGHLMEHNKRVHLKIREFKCSFCPKEFSKRHDWYRHEEIHKKRQNSLSSFSTRESKDKACASQESDTGVVASKDAALEKISVEGSSNPEAVINKCQFCLKIFQSLVKLQEHNKSTHSGDRPYQCDQCDKNYLAMSHLRRHWDRVHSDTKELKCSSRKYAFHRHENTHRKRGKSLSSPIIQASVDEVHSNGTGVMLDEVGAATKEVSAKESSNHTKIQVRVNPESPFPATDEQDEPGEKNDQSGNKAVSHGIFIHKCCDCEEEFWSTDARKEQTVTGEDGCEQCDRMKPWLEILKRHYSQTKHHIERLKCCKCNKFFQPEADADQNTVVANPTSAAPSSEDTESVISSDGNENQMPRSTDPKASSTLTCRFCKKVFKSLLLLLKHKSTAHTRKRHFKCGKCDKMYFAKGHLTEHEIRVHTNIRRFTCEYCSKKFYKKSEWQSHEETHVKGKKRSFPRCKRKASEPNNLSHIDIKKPMSYLKAIRKSPARDECGKEYKSTFNLKRHYMQVHSRIKEFNNSFCNKEFSRKVGVQRHEYVHLKEGKPPAFVCRLCQENFSSRPELERHKRKVHVEKLRCNKCGKVVAGKRNLKEHNIRVHLKSSFVTCKICGKGFCTPSELALHEYAHARLLPPCNLCGLKHLNFSFSRQKSWNCRCHNLNPGKQKSPNQMRHRFQCMTCGESFSRMSNFKHHLDVHQAGKEPVFCLVCGKHFTISQHLQRHRTMFHFHKLSKNSSASSKENPMKCLHCGERFSKRTLLISHLNRSHSEQQKHSCDLCQVSFATSLRLELHRQQVHPGGKIMFCVCKICNKRFHFQYLLRIHSKLHSLSKVFTCTTCSQQFQTERCLLAHQREHKLKKFMCDICGKRYPSQYYLTQHMTIHSGVKDFICEHCGKAFRTKQGIIKHSKVHALSNQKKEFTCETCGRIFPNNSLLGIHRRSHRDKRRKCKVCNLVCKNQARLTIHMRKHTGERPYRCQYCPKRFRVTNTLRDHENIHTGKKPHTCKICGACFASHGSLYHHKRVHEKKKAT